MKIKRICEVCGKEFETIPSRIKEGKGKYCSKECYTESQKGHTPKYITPEIKEEMRIAFTGENNPRWKGGKSKRICDECGEKFERYLSPSMLQRNKGRFCSSECAHKNRGRNNQGKNNPNYKPKIKLVCQECGNQFEVNPSRKDTAHFCSNECYSHFKIKQIQNLETHPCYKPEIRIWIDENQGKHFCQCGCGSVIKIEKWHYSQGIPKYLRNHGQKSKEVQQKIREARMKQKAFPKHHTNPELVFEEICKKYNLPFHYVGDGSLWIGKKKPLNPDFCELNGKKIVIEVFGDYWHSPLLNRNMQNHGTLKYRKRYYRRYKWQSIFLWESDLLRKDAEQFVLNTLQKEGAI